jgi:hypothetical protein
LPCLFLLEDRDVNTESLAQSHIAGGDWDGS